MSWGNVIVVVGGLVAGYAIVSVLMKTSADDLRPPPRRDASTPPPPPPLPLPAPHSAPASVPASGVTRLLKAPQAGDWSLILDIPRSASPRDIEAAFRRQQAKVVGDPVMLERLRFAREAALAEKKKA